MGDIYINEIRKIIFNIYLLDITINERLRIICYGNLMTNLINH